LDAVLPSKGVIFARCLTISALKVDNKKMAATIVKLEETINQFVLKIRELKQENTTQKTAFQRLLAENKQLDITVHDLSNKIPVDRVQLM